MDSNPANQDTKPGQPISSFWKCLRFLLFLLSVSLVAEHMWKKTKDFFKSEGGMGGYFGLQLGDTQIYSTMTEADIKYRAGQLCNVMIRRCRLLLSMYLI